MSEREEFSKLSPVKKCPICGGKLVKGYFNAPRGVYWSTKKHKLGLILFDSVMPGALWTQDNVPALRCENCGIAIIDYNPPRYTPESFLKECVECGKKIPIASEKCPYCGAEQKESVKT